MAATDYAIEFRDISKSFGSVAANSTISIRDVNKAYATFTMPPYSNSGTILITAAGMTNGSNYTIAVGSSTVSATATNSLSNSMGSVPGGGRR